MFAADPPTVVALAQATDESDVIEIVGTRSDQVQKIDRRAYRVQQNPHSAQKDAVQLLRGLPAVTVSPNDDIMLLGSGNVRIFADGRPYPGDAAQYLRTLHGGDIERIEIITNPSAQYSSEGTAGIINFVLRKKQGEGASGTAIVELSSLGHGYLDATLKTRHGKWTYEFHAGGRIGTNARSTYHKLRSTEETPGGTATANTENGDRRSHGVEGEGSAKATYELDAKTSISAMILGGGWRDLGTTNANFEGVTSDFQSFTERGRDKHASSILIGQLNFDHKGSKEGETLTAGLTVYGHPTARERSTANFSNGGALSIDRLQRLLGVYGQADWQHPIGKREILSIGGTWNYRQLIEHYQFTSTGGDGSLGPDAVDQDKAVDDNLAAYATFQQAIGSWTVMPGIRVERNNRRISSPGVPDVRIDRTDLFPTFHVEHRLSKAFDLTLSYSKRIDRAQEELLRPYRTVEDVLTILEGNPHLKAQSTNSYEINLHYHRNKIDAGLIIYDRETSRLWSRDYTVVGGINVYQWVNTGHSRDSGAEFDVSTPIVKRVKLNASVNLFDERAPVDTLVGSASEDRFRYTTNATLEWDGADRGKTPGDVAQLRWIFNSPSSEFQFRRFSWNELSLSYTHSFSRTVSLTGTMKYDAANRHRLIAPLVQEYYATQSPVELKLKLLKTFGKP